MFRKLSLEQALQQKEDKGGNITGQFSEIGQNRGKLGNNWERATFPFTSLPVVSQLQLIALNQKLSEFNLGENQVTPFRDWSLQK